MTMRKPLIAGNWKMFKTAPEAVELASGLKSLVSDVTDVDVMVAPPFTALVVVADILKGSAIHLGGQDLFWETEGAYTGQVSAPMLKAAGCSHVIIGHSERRQYFGETNATASRKMRRRRCALFMEMKAALAGSSTKLSARRWWWCPIPCRPNSRKRPSSVSWSRWRSSS